jgi:hypothetical protein
VKLKYDAPLSNFAFNLNFCRYDLRRIGKHFLSTTFPLDMAAAFPLAGTYTCPVFSST